MLEEIRRTPPDLIATNSVTWARRLTAVNGTIPILIAALSPVEHGLVASLARPDGNVTGIAIDVGPDLFGAQLDLLLDVALDASHVARLGADAAYPGLRQLWSEGNRRGVGVQEFSCPDRYEPVFLAMVREGAKAILVLPETKHVVYARTVAELARQHRLPLISPFRRLTEAAASCPTALIGMRLIDVSPPMRPGSSMGRGRANCPSSNQASSNCAQPPSRRASRPELSTVAPGSGRRGHRTRGPS